MVPIMIGIMRFPIADADDVRELQQRLLHRGFPLPLDGLLEPHTSAAVRAYQAVNRDAAGVALKVDGICGPITWASLTAPRTGFDTAFYPGDAAMLVWKRAAAYHFVGYYLAAPVHPNASWMGKRKTLADMGWEMLVIYVGRQSQGPGSSIPPDAASGRQHGADALAKTRSEGFAEGTIIYLDVEPLDRVPGNLVDYVNAWAGEIAGKGYVPGVYCHVKNAAELRERTAVTGAPISFWVSGSRSGFTPGTSEPGDSGVAFARIWQGTFNQKRTFGGVTLNIDENVA